MVNQKKQNRIAIVTGGSGGIGRIVAERLASDGMSVAISYNSNAERANAIVANIEENGGSAISVRADVGDENDVKTLFAQTEEAFGGIDVVVNSAGLMFLSTIESLDLENLDKMHRTNIRGTFIVNQLAAQNVRSGGAIINFSSSVKKLALPTYAGYAASKGAVDAISLILARELAGRDITVNAVAPGPVATPLFLDGKDEATIERLAGLNPMKRLGEPQDIAEIVSLLAGAGRWINGQVIYANGGMI